MKIFSPAKINLTLDVKAKQPGSSFHEIETIYHKVNWGDTLTLEPSNEFEIRGNFDCALEDNLIYQAWQRIETLTLKDRSLFSSFGRKTGLKKLPPVRVTVEKKIPTGAGLGGGSSNAASFVLAYFELFEQGALPHNLVMDLGNLGKDISFFLQKSPCALGTQFGEVIKPLNFNFSRQTVYLYFSPSPSNTTTAYAQLKNFNTNYTQKFLAKPNLSHCGNTFESIFEQKKCSNVYLSGSGSTWFSFGKIDVPELNILKTTLF